MVKLSVVGLGKLGACTAACFASKGYQVIGVDSNRDVVDAVNRGESPVQEPGLQERILSCGGRLKATQDYGQAIEGSDVTFLIVPTPSRADGHFSDRYLKNALLHLSKTLRGAGKSNHVFVITSTVSPGTTEKSLIPYIEANTGMKLGEGFGVAYNPEFIALGSVIRDFLNPDMVLIGESDGAVGGALEQIYKAVCESKPYIARMSLVSAEITKISLNSYVTMKISFANTLANISEGITGADVDAITRALGADRRVSPHYLKGGLSFGGPCFPRDNRAFSAFARGSGVDARLAKATDEINQRQVERIVDLVMRELPAGNGMGVAILGLAYKPETNVIEESAGVKIVQELLKKKDVEVVVYDPLAMENARVLFGDNTLYAASVRECFESSSLCVITTTSSEFDAIDGSYVVNEPTTIVDCWRRLDAGKLGPKVRYIALGRNHT